MAKEAKEPSEPTPAPHPSTHDLMDAEAARQLLKMPAAKFELLISTGQVRVFRSEGQPCFRREDIAALALKRQAAPAKSTAPRKPASAAPAPGAPATPAAKSSPRAEAVKPPLPKATPSIPKPSAANVPDDMEDEEFEEPPPPEARQKSRSISRFLLPAAIVVAIAALAMTFNSARKHEDVPVAATPSTGSASTPGAFANSKAAPGLIESISGERPLSFEVGGKIHSVMVEEGQTVNAGDPIAELENADLNARQKSSQADLSAAEAKLGLLNGNLECDLKKAESEVLRLKAEILLLEPRPEDIERAKAELAATEADATRLAEDAKRNANAHAENTGAVPQQVVDQTRRLAEAAAAKCSASKAQLRALESGSRKEDKDRLRALLASAEAEVARQQKTSAFQIQSAKAQVDQARAQVDLVKADLQKTIILATISGTVVRKYMHPGEVIDALHPQPVVTVADLTQLRVRADVDEADFPGIAVGQRVKITADAWEEGKFLTGVVERISTTTGQKRFSTGEAREKMDIKVVETIVKFDAPPPPKLVKLNLRVTAYFELTH